MTDYFSGSPPLVQLQSDLSGSYWLWCWGEFRGWVLLSWALNPSCRSSRPRRGVCLGQRVLTRVHQSTAPLSLTVSGNHHKISFLVYHSSNIPVILGHSWLVEHNLQINWSKYTILSWNLSCCHVKCLVSAMFTISSVSVFQEEPGDLSGVPEEYHDLRVVFSRSRAACPVKSCYLIPTVPATFISDQSRDQSRDRRWWEDSVLLQFSQACFL